MRIPSISRRQALTYAVVMVALLALVGRSLVGRDGEEAAAPVASAESIELVELAGETEVESATLLVHVAGAVREPGVYDLAAGSRVADAVGRAGGPRARAALENINLAAALVDGQQVVVPMRVPGEGGGAAASSTGAARAQLPVTEPGGRSGSQGPLISLSSATATQLQELPGVGPVTAERIIAHREEHGAFCAVDELAAVCVASAPPGSRRSVTS